ncbi:ATP-binding protein [Pseudonocardiaceae bacterium YIM PH 21723]|nr:ATP-binding protein [Pseudonocardiaceae bacterium YIM PH 21723]
MTPLWRGTAWLRIVTLVFAIGIAAVHSNEYMRPWLAWSVLGVMTVWTGVTFYWYRRSRFRTKPVVLIDLAVSCGLMLTSLAVMSEKQFTDEFPLITTIWVAGAVSASAVLGGRFWGIGGGAAMALTNWVIRGNLHTDLLRDTVLLMGVGFLLGMCADTARDSAEKLHRALRAEAATAERERLARQIHDSVLQVLARVRRRGNELGGEAEELAKLAGEQEIALRSLVAAAPADSNEEGETDLRGRLQLLTTSRFQVSVPATQVMLPSGTAAELVAITVEALANVDKHAGIDAKAWVLLEDLGDEVVLSIRDDGIGMRAGRLDQAEQEGRIGVRHSIRGRIRELGGRVELHTAPAEGVEWEVHIPRIKGAN